MKGSDKVSKVKSVKASEPVTRSRPALTPEGRDNQMMSLAINLAEEQLRNGTASSQVITHYLKMAANKEKEKLEREKLASGYLPPRFPRHQTASSASGSTHSISAKNAATDSCSAPAQSPSGKVSPLI